MLPFTQRINQRMYLIQYSYATKNLIQWNCESAYNFNLSRGPPSKRQWIPNKNDTVHIFSYVVIRPPTYSIRYTVGSRAVITSIIIICYVYGVFYAPHFGVFVCACVNDEMRRKEGGSVSKPRYSVHNSCGLTHIYIWRKTVFVQLWYTYSYIYIYI